MFNLIGNQKNDHLNPVEMPFHTPSAGKIFLKLNNTNCMQG